MKRFWSTLLFSSLLAMVGLALVDTPNLKPYQSGDWKSVAKIDNGAPMAIHFWGVTCPACVKDMPQWGQFLKSNPNAKAVFIQVDDVSADSIKKMLSKAGLENANNYYVTPPFDERMRYEIDPKWHGETPTTIVIDKSGKTTRKTGLIDFRQLKTAIGS